jgi:thymidine kinase
VSGHLEVICGPMYAGKSEELIRRVRRVGFAGQKAIVFKPWIDDRYSVEEVVSHAGNRVNAYPISTSDMSWDDMADILDNVEEPDVIAIDEVQFFNQEMVDTIKRNIIYKRVIVSGLDMDFRKEPFGIMSELLAIAKFVDKLRAVCHSCGEDAMYTQRLVNGKPAPLDGETVIVGGTEQYEARCENCWEAK